MSIFKVPNKNEVSNKNREILENVDEKLGFIPNLYSTYAYSENALKNYLDFNSSKTSLNNKEKEVVNLVVSQVNECLYCLSAHTAMAKDNGFTEGQILEIRSGNAPFDSKLNALVNFTKEAVEKRGKVSENTISNFLEAGYTKENLIDTMLLIGDKTISNYVHNAIDFPIDFPEVKTKEEAFA